MKKLFTTLLLSAGLIATSHAALTVTANGVNVEKETTIEVNEFKDQFGTISMETRGIITSSESNTITVTIERTPGITDQFCYGQCYNGNGEATEKLNFPITNDEWYAHYIPTKEGEEIITYTFDDGKNEPKTLTVKYNYMPTAIENTTADKAAKGVYTLEGQYVAEQLNDNLPAGIYIVNGKKQVVH